MVHQILNNPESLVAEAVDGLLLTAPHQRRLDGYPDIKVVFDSGHDRSKVAVISGGGAGHEPAHIGYVGSGMLTAAVSGEVFASPSAEAVLAAIRTVTGPQGCLLIIKNYTGDRLHFGLAAEHAKAEGYEVEMVVVGEDVAIEQPGLAGRRGLAGTVLVHKVAGAAAAEGRGLQEVAAAARAVAESCATLGVALRVCTLPGKQPSSRLAQGEMEVGLGIHGEPGHIKTQAMGAQALVQLMLDHIAASHFFSLQAGERVVLLANNLGATTPLEMGCVVKEAIDHLTVKYKAEVLRCWCGPFMTSLDMAGCSLTLLRVPPGPEGDTLLTRLDVPVRAPGWPHTSAKVVVPNAPAALPAGPGAPAAAASRPAQLTPSGRRLERALTAAAEALIAASAELNELDAQVGDGDCGDTVAHGARAILADLATKYPLNDAAACVAAVAVSVQSAVGGTSGALYGVGLTAAARKLKELGTAAPGPCGWALALAEGAAAVQKYGGARPGSRTMIDALQPAAEALRAAADAGATPEEAADAAAKAAQHGADATVCMSASAGRASYIPASALRTPDPGAVAVSTWMTALADSLKLSL